MSRIKFTVNGILCEVSNSIPRYTSLNDYIRNYLHLSGTKVLCRIGGCGICIVTVRAYNYTTGELHTFSVNSCLVLVFSCHGWEITTVEGIGDRNAGYHPIQTQMAELHGSQCGYCTPGWIMQLYSLQDKGMTKAELEDSFGSNQCRCTGYRPILDTIKSFAADASLELCGELGDIEDVNVCTKAKHCKRYSNASMGSDWSLVSDVNNIKDSGIIYLDYGQEKYFKVFNEDQIFQILNTYGLDSYMLLDGNTSQGIIENFEYPNIVVDIGEVESLKLFYFEQNLVLGANVTLQNCIKIFRDTAKTNIDFIYLEEFAKHFEVIAHIPVREIGTLAGNLMLKHQIPGYQSDVFVLFEAVGASVTLLKNGGQKVTLSLLDFLQYNMQGVLIFNLKLPPLNSSYTFRRFKIAPRNQNALAIVNAGFLLKINGSNIIENARIVYGNISAEFNHAQQTEKLLTGKNVYNNNTLRGAIRSLNREVNPEVNPPEPSPECRKKLAIGLFYRFILSITPSAQFTGRYLSGASEINRPLSQGIQDYPTNPSLYPLNQPITKLEALIQCSGEAKYTNDLPPLPQEVFAAFVLSTVHNGDVDNIDASDAFNLSGVLELYTAEDIPGKNSFIYVPFETQSYDEEILAGTNIKFYGQPIAIIVADTEYLAAEAAKKVKVTYKNVTNSPPVLTINEARKYSERIVASPFKITPKGRGNDVKKVVKGIYDIGTQYHYYMEPLTCIVLPVDEGLEVHAATQWSAMVQLAISQCLDMQLSDIQVITRRLGGAFGGKITRTSQVAAACALVAKKMNRPCRFILPMDTNMTIAGARLPAHCEYEAGVDDDGKIQYLEALLLEDAGCSANEDVLHNTIGGFMNCYNTDYFKLAMATVLTDHASNTNCRAPGTSEGIACIEHIMEHIAYVVQKDSIEVRLLNMRTEDNNLPLLIDTLKKDANYDARVQEIKKYNEGNRWMKKAISTSLMSFPLKYLGTYNVLVSIYRKDGSVTLATAGIEMGQGINTKASQVCAYELGIPVDYVKIVPYYSFVSANNIATAGSFASETICYAVINCCKVLNERLQPVKDELKNATWAELIERAADEQIPLSTLYSTSEFDPNLKSYNIFAVAFTEVILDVITGKFQITRTDILEDVGLSISPKIDIGQIEGAHLMGLSYFTMEKFVYNTTTGKLLTNRNINYEIYEAKDIPVDYRIKFQYNTKNPTGILGSKSVGEMGVCTAYGVTHALRRCIMESRLESGYTDDFIDIDIPLVTESILKALDVHLTEFSVTP